MSNASKLPQYKTSVHFNGHMPCSIDTETTGLTPGFHDIIQIAVVPLNPDFTPNLNLMPFELKLQPKRPENASKGAFKVHKMTMDNCTTHGIDPWDAVDRFEEWVARLHLPEKKQIVPVGHNYTSYDRLMIKEWLGGWEMYNHLFHWHIRDTMTALLFQNDLADMISEMIPFPKASLGFLCSVLKVPILRAHDALCDAMAAAECYRRLMRHQLANHPDVLTGHIRNIQEQILANRPDKSPSCHTAEDSSSSPSVCNPALLDEECKDYPAELRTPPAV